jgi:geranylgeranyl reductase family protein
MTAGNGRFRGLRRSGRRVGPGGVGRIDRAVLPHERLDRPDRLRVLALEVNTQQHASTLDLELPALRLRLWNARTAQHPHQPAGDVTGGLAEPGREWPGPDERADARHHDRDGGQDAGPEFAQPRRRARVLDVGAGRAPEVARKLARFVVRGGHDREPRLGEAARVQRVGGRQRVIGPVEEREDQRVRHGPTVNLKARGIKPRGRERARRVRRVGASAAVRHVSATRSADIGIVGAGPAGAWAAFHLARAGARVRIFDGSHPREKPCGGGVTGRALALLGEAAQAARRGGVRIPSARFVDPRTGPAVVTLDEEHADGSLTVVDRARFDAALLEAACAEGAVHLPHRVRDLGVTDSGVTLHTDRGPFTCGRVIGADGANSLVRRRLFRPFTRRQLSIASGYFARGVISREIVVGFVSSPAGYIWSFPRADHLAIGICAQADEATSGTLRASLDAWLAEHRLAAGGTLARYGWPIPSLGAGDLDDEQAAGERWLLVGDAAGLVDPITREGIFFAIRSGQLAAAALSGAEAAREYRARLGDEIYPELYRAARLKRGFFRGAFTHLLVDALRHSGAVRGIMADLIEGRQPYATLKRRLLGTFHLGLAWRLLLLEWQRRR